MHRMIRKSIFTITLGKLYEKVINKRLIWFLESNNILANQQYGFRKNRSIIQAAADLQIEV